MLLDTKIDAASQQTFWCISVPLMNDTGSTPNVIRAMKRRRDEQAVTRVGG